MSLNINKVLRLFNLNDITNTSYEYETGFVNKYLWKQPNECLDWPVR